MSKSKDLVPMDEITRRIVVVRGRRVMLDADLAELYEVETRVLVQAVKRNIERFPSDFMFQLTHDEFGILRSQFVMSSYWGGRRHPPYAFTEHGVAMLSSVLRSSRAVEANIAIMRAFVRLRQAIVGHGELAGKLAELERRVGVHDRSLRTLFAALRGLMTPAAPEKRRVGFRTDEGQDSDEP